MLSRKNSRASSVSRLTLRDKRRYEDGDGDENTSAFYTPIPTTGTPTETLAYRFQAWRKVLKDLITYFREIQASYEQRGKSLAKISNVISSTSAPSMFAREGGLAEGTRILRDFHRQAAAETSKAQEIETGVISQLTGLRGDLSQKIREIKNLSGDFKNTVDKEMDGTRRAVQSLQEALELAETHADAATGKHDPFIVRLAVERQLERQIEEENYLHRAFLNLEGSGRELESIVVGEIQKAYNAYAGILKREADENYEAVERLRSGPVSMAKDQEWSAFVERDEHFVDPRLPLRRVEDIRYPGRNHPAAAEVRAGMLERKSKYLKSYTPGWYVLSPTHLHEFKSADRLSSQTPVMSLLLTEQKLGTHSQPGSSSHKFMVKGRQTGSMHRGHSWVFRAESHDTMLAWYGDMKALTEKSGEERNAFVRRHARSVSNGSQKAGSISSDGMLDEDEADEVPYSGAASSVEATPEKAKVDRPQPGGRFPSDVQVDRGLRAARSISSVSSEPDGRDGSSPTAARVRRSASYKKPPQQQQQQHQNVLVRSRSHGGAHHRQAQLEQLQRPTPDRRDLQPSGSPHVVVAGNAPPRDPAVSDQPHAGIHDARPDSDHRLIQESSNAVGGSPPMPSANDGMVDAGNANVQPRDTDMNVPGDSITRDFGGGQGRDTTMMMMPDPSTQRSPDEDAVDEMPNPLAAHPPRFDSPEENEQQQTTYPNASLEDAPILSQVQVPELASEENQQPPLQRLPSSSMKRDTFGGPTVTSTSMEAPISDEGTNAQPHQQQHPTNDDSLTDGITAPQTQQPLATATENGNDNNNISPPAHLTHTSSHRTDASETEQFHDASPAVIPVLDIRPGALNFNPPPPEIPADGMSTTTGEDDRPSEPGRRRTMEESGEVVGGGGKNQKHDSVYGEWMGGGGFTNPNPNHTSTITGTTNTTEHDHDHNRQV